MGQLSLPLNLNTAEISGSNWFGEILATLGVRHGSAWPDRFGLSLRQWLLNHGHRPIKTLSLFSGGGGLDIGFHDAGFDIVQMVELDPRYVQTLEKNSLSGKWLENSHPICIDIRNYFPEPDLKVDFIIGGPPCQTFSAAGRRAAGVSGTSVPQGNLFQEYVRLLKTLQPQGFLFENVYGITGANQGKAWQTIKNAFEEAGYQISFRILDAADYGVPQHRERLFIVGWKEGKYLFPYPTHGPDSLNQEAFYSAGAAVDGADISGIEPGIGGRYGHLLKDIPPGLNYSFYTEKMGHPNPVFSWRSKFSDFLYKADPNSPVRTIKAQGGQYTGPFSWENRRFSLAELKRLQTIPDDYELVGNQQVCIEQIGNSVPPQLGRILALSILDQFLEIPLPVSMYYMKPSKKLGFRQRKRKLTEIYMQKAKEAIATLQNHHNLNLISNSSYRCQGKDIRFIDRYFNWSQSHIPDSKKIKIEYKLTNCLWSISANQEKEEISDGDQFIIEILPAYNNTDWLLNTKSVKLSAKNLDKLVFTALWKAFEEKLINFTSKADLVQLSGYYQYLPKISGILNFHPEVNVDSFWRVVQCIVRGIGVANQLTAQQFADLWGVNNKDIFDYLQTLRNMGYEIRNKKTNPQIKPGKYLIPYAFPTLNPKSIQSRKSLI